MLWSSFFLFFGVNFKKQSNFGRFQSSIGEIEIMVPDNNKKSNEISIKKNTYKSSVSREFDGQDCRYELVDGRSLSDWILDAPTVVENDTLVETPAQRMEKNFKKFAILTDLESPNLDQMQKLALLTREYPDIFGETTYGINRQLLYRGMEDFL